MGRGDVICARIDVDADTVGDAVVDDAVGDADVMLRSVRVICGAGGCDLRQN